METTIFKRAALRLIVKQSLGIPRKINIICDNALRSGFAYGMKPVPVKIVKDVIADLDGKRTRVSVKWVITCASMAFLFLVISGLAIYKLLDSRRSPSINRQPARQHRSPHWAGIIRSRSSAA